MREVEDLLYILYDKENKIVKTSGMQFEEFYNSLAIKPNNILILEGDFCSDQFDYTTRCEYCSKENIHYLLNDNIYNYGDFSWVDFKTVEGLEALKPKEVAELLYLARFSIPINDTYFKKLYNRFFYYAHDDGWYNHTYYNDIEEFNEILGYIIVNKIRAIYNLQPEPLDIDIINRLCKLAYEGISIDFLRLCIKEDDSIAIPIYKIGSDIDMDSMYEMCRYKDIFVDYELHYQRKWEIEKL